MFPGLTDEDRATVIEAVRARRHRPTPAGARRGRADDRRLARRRGTREIRVGLAGLGSMGRNHLRVLASRPGARLVAIADPVADVARRGRRPDRRARASPSRWR